MYTDKNDKAKELKFLRSIADKLKDTPFNSLNVLSGPHEPSICLCSFSDNSPTDSGWCLNTPGGRVEPAQEEI